MYHGESKKIKIKNKKRREREENKTRVRKGLNDEKRFFECRDF